MRTCLHSDREGVEGVVEEVNPVVMEGVGEEVGEEVGEKVGKEVVEAAASDGNHHIFLKILLMLKYTILHQTALASQFDNATLFW